MPVDPLMHLLDAFIQRNRLIDDGGKILAAVSGGIDSIVLLDCLDVYGKRHGLEIAVAHFNHHLRGAESDEDEDFVQENARQRSLLCITGGADILALSVTQKCSIQEAARNARYAFLSETRKSIGFDKIATAHHADDNAETMLLNFFRGTGIRGLSGIPVHRTDLEVIRPILFATKDQISQYAERHHLEYREDSSNAKSDYTRNAVRHRIIPLVRDECNPDFVSTMFRTAGLFRELGAYLEVQTEKLESTALIGPKSGTPAFDRRVILNQPRFLREYFLWRAGSKVTGSTLHQATIAGMMDVIEGETGSSCSIGNGYSMIRDRDRLCFVKNPAVEGFTYPIRIGEEYHIGSFRFRSSRVSDAELNTDPNIEFVDEAAIGTDLQIRTWQASDWFIPLGMHQKKKISDFFIDSKIPLTRKHSIPVVVADGAVVWICGLRLDDRVKITERTNNIIKLEYTPDILP